MQVVPSPLASGGGVYLPGSALKLQRLLRKQLTRCTATTTCPFETPKMPSSRSRSRRGEENYVARISHSASSQCSTFRVCVIWIKDDDELRRACESEGRRRRRTGNSLPVGRYTRNRGMRRDITKRLCRLSLPWLRLTTQTNFDVVTLSRTPPMLITRRRL